MREKVAKILTPLVLVGIAAIQSFGVDFVRHAKSSFTLADSLKTQTDSTLTDSTRATDSLALADTIVLNDSLSSTDTFETDSLEGETIVLSARDTIKAPDSLRLTDPFKFKYYLAIKDSLTRAMTRDSLFNAGDTLELMRLDSLYIKDSTEVAEAAWLAKWNSMSRRERKAWQYEQELPAKMHRMDSILHRKDSLKARRDSILENTPRILETYVLPDSMLYKRIITWNHDRDFNDLRLQPFDTSYNYHFYDSPVFKKDFNATYLGISGSAAQVYNYFKREEEQDAIFFTPYRLYTYSAETLPFYNTKTPYTELAYWGTLFAAREKEESNIKILTSQNILPSLNLTLEYHRFGGNGMLKNEKTDNRTAVVSMNYLGKRYLMHAAYIYNKVSRNENGGIMDNSKIRDTTVDAREIDVFLNKATNKFKHHTIFLDQNYRFQMNFAKKDGTRAERKAYKHYKDSVIAAGDSTAIAELLAEEADRNESLKADVDKDMTSAFIGHTSEFSVYTKLYGDEIGLSDLGGSKFYNNNFFLNPTTSADSMRVMRVENKVFLRLQPWKSDAIVSKIDVGIADKVLSYYNFTPTSYIVRNKNAVQHSMYVYAGVQGQYKKYLEWNAKGYYDFLGHEINDFGISANVTFKAYPFRRDRKSPLAITGHFETSLKEPNFYQQHFYSNHFRWNNDFGKTSTTKVEAVLQIPRWKLEASFGYALLSNNIYYDNLGIARQNTTPMSIMTATLTKNFKVWLLHFDHRMMFQLSSNPEVVPLPMFSANFRYYLQFNVVKKVMQMQIGVDARYNTRWYAQGYNPVLGVFYNQNEEKYGNCAYLDAFINIQWKRACIFLKAENVGMGWPSKKADYFSAHHYINTPRAFKIGIFWPFYIQPGKNASVGGAAGASRGSSSGDGLSDGPLKGGGKSGKGGMLKR